MLRVQFLISQSDIRHALKNLHYYVCKQSCYATLHKALSYTFKYHLFGVKQHWFDHSKYIFTDGVKIEHPVLNKNCSIFTPFFCISTWGKWNTK